MSDIKSLIQQRDDILQHLGTLSQLQSQIAEIRQKAHHKLQIQQQKLFALCPHKWEEGCEQGIDEPREKICRRCGCHL